MFSESEQEFLKDKDLSDFVAGSPMEYGTYLFQVSGIKKNGKILENKLDDETLGLQEYAQHLYSFEWQQLERLLLESDIPDCNFEVKGLVSRREDNTGDMVVFSLLAK